MNVRRARVGAGVALVAALLALALPAAARADAVVDWNVNATNALIATAGQTPPVSVLHLAMVHGAVYDAVNAIDGRHQAYLVTPAAMPWDSKDAAAASGAYRVLLSLVPAQEPALTSLYAASLAAVPAGPARDGGIAAGEAAAAAMIAARANDGRFGAFRFPVGSTAGVWRPELPAFVSDPFAWIKDVKPFVIPSPSQFQSAGPNPITSAAYAAEFNEVKALGSATSTVRTADQTDAANFWAAGPAANWSRIFRSLSAAQGLSTVDNARFFAQLYVSAADAFISCWTDKAHWSFWRPITAIREADSDGNPATQADPTWTPLLATPPYPDHPSGLPCFSGSVVETLQAFFGSDNVAFSAFNPASGTTRSFKSFSQAIQEVIDVRVWSGIHFRIADVQGALIGKQVSDWVGDHAFCSVRGRSSRRLC